MQCISAMYWGNGWWSWVWRVTTKLTHVHLFLSIPHFHEAMACLAPSARSRNGLRWTVVATTGWDMMMDVYEIVKLRKLQGFVFEYWDLKASRNEMFQKDVMPLCPQYSVMLWSLLHFYAVLGAVFHTVDEMDPYIHKVNRNWPGCAALVTAWSALLAFLHTATGSGSWAVSLWILWRRMT